MNDEDRQKAERELAALKRAVDEHGNPSSTGAHSPAQTINRYDARFWNVVATVVGGTIVWLTLLAVDASTWMVNTFLLVWVVALSLYAAWAMLQKLRHG